ncbi:hypothetical protein BB561_006300 [Smittium simulii]|uniref:Uncharacterized protein n=1 Tax=Smittium simulii TaxID=133385 RepID=A0A2T9Y5A7_9FUNG|nr:hypothetical protein BB561_006300 [Smittium simulii]
MLQMGDIIEFLQPKKSHIISTRFLSEFLSLPYNLLNTFKARAKIQAKTTALYLATFKHSFLMKRFCSVFFNKHLDTIIQADIACIEKFLNIYISKNGISLNSDIIKIPDISDLLIYIYSENAFIRILGSNLSRSPDVKKSGTFLSQSMYNTYNSFLHRQLEDNFLMSNGVLIPKGSSLSLNLFSRYYKPSQKSTPKNADNINPNTVPQKFTTKKSDHINLNIASQNDFDASCLVWGSLK